MMQIKTDYALGLTGQGKQSGYLEWIKGIKYGKGKTSYA